MKRKCPICKTRFKPKQWKQKYCCPACYNVARHAQDRARAKRNYYDPNYKPKPKKPNAKCPCCGVLSWRKKYGKGMTYHYCKSCQLNLFVRQNIGNPGQEMYCSW